jgi:P pilus assembly chaperone PapD
VFVLATEPDEGMYLRWQAVRTAADELTVTALNSGATHVQVTGFRLLAGGDTAAQATEPRYVLPNSRMSWTLKVPSGTGLSDLRVDGRSDMGEFAADVEILSNVNPAVRAAR